jgi:hypothetical protein
MQSEYMALSEASREAVARAQFFEELNIPSMPVVLLSDNEAALDLADGTTTNHRKSSISTSDITKYVTLFKKGRWKSVISQVSIKLLISSRNHWVRNGISCWST